MEDKIQWEDLSAEGCNAPAARVWSSSDLTRLHCAFGTVHPGATCPFVIGLAKVGNPPYSPISGALVGSVSGRGRALLSFEANGRCGSDSVEKLHSWI
jgi:hypothetical protein